MGDNIGSVGWPTSGEMDIMENVGFEPSTVHGTIHGSGYSGGSAIGAGYTLPGGQVFADAFHTFTVDWKPTAITCVIVNVAVRGNWPGSPNASTAFPQTLTIDYVRVYAWTSGGGGATGPIVGFGGKCADVAGANSANGTRIQLWDCNGTVAQRWTMGTDGTRVQLWDCNGTGAQRWQATAARELVNPQSGKCLDATGVSSANGTPLQIWQCTGGANQKWTVPA